MVEPIQSDSSDYISGGYIVLARKIEEENSTFRHCKNNHQRWMFIKSLLRANFQDNIVNGIELKRGEFLTSIGEFAREAHTTEKKVRGFWQKFSKLGFLALKRTNKYTIVTILNYDRYQKTENYIREKGQAEGQTKGKQRATDNKYNKDNKVNNSEILLKQAKEELGRMAKVEDIAKWLKKLHPSVHNQLRFFLLTRYPNNADRAWGEAEAAYKRGQPS